MFREAEEEKKKEQEDLQRRWTYAMEMTMKSSQFQGSRRNVKLSIAKPRATILVRDSKVQIPVKVYLDGKQIHELNRLQAVGQSMDVLTDTEDTHSTCLDHSGGSLKVLNIQFVKMVHMMIMLNNVRGKSQGNTQEYTHGVLFKYVVILQRNTHTE